MMNNSNVVFYHLPLQVWQRKDWFGSSLGMLHGHLVVNLKEMIFKARMCCILRSAWGFVLALKPVHILITRMEPVSWKEEELAREMLYQLQRKMLSVEFFRNYVFVKIYCHQCHQNQHQMSKKVQILKEPWVLLFCVIDCKVFTIKQKFVCSSEEIMPHWTMLSLQVNLVWRYQVLSLIGNYNW